MNDLSILPSEEAISRLKNELLKLPQFEPITRHHFANGMYMRTLWSPADTVIVGKVHKTEHFYALLTGIIQVTTDQGVVELNATRDGPQVLICPVGTRRAVCVIEDAWRMNVHLNPDNLSDIDAIEAMIAEHDESSKFLPGNRLKQEMIA